MPTDITQDNYTTVVEQSSTPVVIDVYADWCGPCQMMMPIFEGLEKELGSKYAFTKLNIDNARDLAIQLGVTSVPTFVFVKDGKVVGKATGYMNAEALKEKIESNLG